MEERGKSHRRGLTVILIVKLTLFYVGEIRENAELVDHPKCTDAVCKLYQVSGSVADSPLSRMLCIIDM